MCARHPARPGRRAKPRHHEHRRDHERGADRRDRGEPQREVGPTARGHHRAEDGDRDEVHRALDEEEGDRAAGDPLRRHAALTQIHAPRARPPAPLAGTIDPAPSSARPISQLVRQGMLWQKTGRNITRRTRTTAPRGHGKRHPLRLRLGQPVANLSEARGKQKHEADHGKHAHDLERAPGEPPRLELGGHLECVSRGVRSHGRSARPPRSQGCNQIGEFRCDRRI